MYKKADKVLLHQPSSLARTARDLRRSWTEGKKKKGGWALCLMTCRVTRERQVAWKKKKTFVMRMPWLAASAHDDKRAGIGGRREAFASPNP